MKHSATLSRSAVSDVISPVSGVVAEVNEVLLDHPEMIATAPMRRG